jgi:hypothetical protein
MMAIIHANVIEWPNERCISAHDAIKRWMDQLPEASAQMPASHRMLPKINRQGKSHEFVGHVKHACGLSAQLMPVSHFQDLFPIDFPLVLSAEIVEIYESAHGYVTGEIVSFKDPKGHDQHQDAMSDGEAIYRGIVSINWLCGGIHGLWRQEGALWTHVPMQVDSDQRHRSMKGEGMRTA